MIPVLGLLYFSSSFVYNKFYQYTMTNRLEKVALYVSYASNLIKELQKERGLSIASLQSNDQKYFINRLSNQRKKSDRVFRKYAQILSDVDLGISQLRAREIINGYANISLIRDRFDQGKISLEEIFDSYNRLIHLLIESTGVLDLSFVDKEFFYLVDAYKTQLQLAEINGRERAMIAYVLQQKRVIPPIYRKLYRLEAESRNLQDRIHDLSVPVVTLIYRRYVPIKIEKRCIKIKDAVIYQKRLDIIAPQAWWKCATTYINAVYRANDALLQHLLKRKQFIKDEANRALVLSLLFWLVGLGALYLMARIFDKILNRYAQQVQWTEDQRLLNKSLADFTEAIVYTKDRVALMGRLCDALEGMDRFKHVWIAEIKEEKIKPICTEGIAPGDIYKGLHDEHPEHRHLKEEIFHAVAENRNEIITTGKDRELFCTPTPAYGIFPIVSGEGICYLLLLAAKGEDSFNADTLQIINRMTGALLFAFQKLEMEVQERKNKEELEILASAFETHEAVIITDVTGRIIKVNKAFSRITGYYPQEVIGRTPAIMKSGKHDKTFYMQMWDTIRKEGHWQGEIYNRRKNGEIYPELLFITAIRNNDGEVSHYIAHFFDITHLKKALEDARYQAEHDPLTDLYNRQKMMEFLKHLYFEDMKKRCFSALIFIDLDNFKQINDFFGHEAGDKVLIEMGKRLKATMREGDMVARLGGDEFTYIAANLSIDRFEAIKKVTILVEKMMRLFAKPIAIEDNRIEVTFSMGIKLFPDREKSPEDVLADADVAMYHAKRAGKKRYKFFDESLDLEAREFLLMKKELEEAIREDGMTLLYQPKLRVDDSRICGYEAILRWEHPRKGVLEAKEFGYLITSNRLSFEVTRYMLEKLCRQIQELKKIDPAFDPLFAVNIPAGLLHYKDFYNMVKTLLQHYDIDTRQIIFQFEERVLLEHTSKIQKRLQQFKELGLHLSIDNFGKDHSAISSLRKLPFDILKIDRHIIGKLDKKENREIVRIYTDIARILRMKSIAEGVDNQEILDFISKSGCDCWQGSLWGGMLHFEEIVKGVKEDLRDRK